MTLVDGEVLFQRRDAFKVDDKSTIHATVRPTSLTADLAAPLKWSETYAIVGADVHTGSGEDFPKGTVVIDHGRIAAVGTDVKVPANAVVVDGTGLQVYPGFFDAGSDLGLNEIGEVNATLDSRENGPFQPDLLALTSVNPESAKIPIGRCAGVTTAFVTPNGGMIAGQGSIIDLAGYNKDQLGLNPAAALIVNYPDSVSPQEKAFLPAEMVEKREGEVKDQRDALKEKLSEGKRYAEARKADPTLPLDSKLEALVPYVTGAKPTLLVVNSYGGIKAALAMAKDLGLKPILGGAADSWKLAKDLAFQKVPVILTAPQISCPAANQPYGDFDPYDSPLACASQLQAAGVKFALANPDSAGIANLPNSAGVLCAFGLSPKDALRAITLSPAEIFGVADQIGSLEKGKLANVVVTDGDPMEITTQTSYVFIGGKPIQLKSKWTELYRKYERRVPAKK